MFNYVGGYAQPSELENLSISPIDMKSNLIDMIGREAEFARQGRPAEIWAKLNSIIEPDVI